MKRLKWLIVLMCIVLVIGNIPQKGYAFERDDHDEYMLEVFFKNFKEVKNDPSIQDQIKALECASYLTIDQFNNNGQKDLDFLLTYGVKGIPSRVSDISFNASGTTHRSYTHRGWDFQYPTVTKELWLARKQILLSTADKIFDFQEDDVKKDSFCALIYYIHILGDHMDDTSYLIKNGLKMDVGGRIDKEDIIHELLHHIEIIFSDQKHTNKYRSLTGALERYNDRLAKIVRSDGGINTAEKFQQKQEYTDNLMKLLTMYLPEMLKEEQFFYDVFYK